NDTHPALAVIELMRILIDEENYDWDTAWDITVNTFAYTNHTVMPEALERWSVTVLGEILPRHLELIYEMNLRFLKEVSINYPGDNDRLRRMSIIEEGHCKKVRMEVISIIGSHSVNGVSKLHSELIKNQLFKDFYDLYPERFNNKTNGITQRRWLQKSNTNLSNLITEVIGDTWTTNSLDLEKLYPFSKDSSFCLKWQEIKKTNKIELSDYIRKTTGIIVNPESMFDVQVKRIHEYKRQLMFGLFIISEYLKIKKDPKAEFVPKTFIVSGKAAPGYTMAKLIIKFINNIAEVVNKDKTIRNRLKILFLENYRVSLAENIFPASDLSEQISTAGMEASGTGCMKFMMNGALTVGTYDGATIEMCEAVGNDNMFMFGLKVNEIQELKEKGYNPQQYINRSEMLREIVHLIRNNFFSTGEEGLFNPILDNLMTYDPFFICADFDSYCGVQDKISELYKNKKLWTEKSIINVAKSGIFSSDRTIKNYAQDIWGVPC
ncbi:MAG: glycogen/starch/alpha-glucan family phosphorylase, partial [Candidatus Omnitrophica bacterium]|nr:glycogen/starch/alpha-glucan family phosphorylase [Candidatus Omnitrophota bacterium]